MDDYPKYKELSQYYGKPVVSAKNIRQTIRTSCEILKLHVKRNRKLSTSEDLLTCIDTFMKSIKNNDYESMLDFSEKYINSFEKEMPAGYYMNNFNL